MCLYPKIMKNPRYEPNKKNGNNPPICTDFRTRFVSVGCGNCIECRNQKARSWQVRLHEEFKQWEKAYFVTLSFSPESMDALSRITENNNVNELATIATRRFLERWRKKHKTSLKHWFVTELGQTNTERIHIHGIIFNNDEIADEITEIWQYGNTYIGEYCSTRTINYIVKYMTKIDPTHKNYKSIVLASPGIGANYININTKEIHKYRPNNTAEFYKLPNGQKINLPIYYRNKLYTEEERNNLWTEKIDTHSRYVRGVKIENLDTQQGQETLFEYLKTQQAINEKLGYGTDKWKLKDYEITLKMLNK